MDGGFARRESYLFAQFQPAGLCQIYRDPFAIEAGRNNARFSFEFETGVEPDGFLHEPREATRAVTAHFTGAAVAVVEVPGPVRFPRAGRNQNQQPVGANAPVTVAQAHDLVAGQPDSLRPIVQEHKVIARAVHFRKFQKHGCKVQWLSKVPTKMKLWKNGGLERREWRFSRRRHRSALLPVLPVLALALYTPGRR